MTLKSLSQNSEHVPSVSHEVEIGVPVEEVYDTFISNPTDWWPENHSLFGEKNPNIKFEKKEGGKWVEYSSSNNANTERLYWGEIVFLSYPKTIILTWQIDDNWSPVESAEMSSRILISFERMGNNKTLVTLTHYELKNHGESAEKIVAAIEGPSPGPTLYSLKKFCESGK